jgi:hypothetical protein
MKKFIIATLLSITVLFAGCFDGGEDESYKGSEIIYKIPLDFAPKSSEKVVYVETSGFVNLFGENSNIVYAYKELTKNIGTNIDDIEYTLQADNAYLLKGYNLDEYKFMNNLGLKYKEKEYNGANMLVNEDYDYAVAKYKNYLIHGNIDDVEKVIDTINEDYSSITSNEEVKEILSRVDDGYIIANIQEYNGHYTGFFIYSEGDKVKYETVIIFDNSDEAKENYYNMEDELKREKDSGNIYDYDISRDGNIVEVRATLSKESFLNEFANTLGFEVNIENTNTNQEEFELDNKEKNTGEQNKEQTTVKFTNYHDDFNYFNNNFWMAKEWVTLNDAYNKIKVENGILDMPVEETDRCGFVVSKSIPVEKGDIIKIKRKVKMHYANEYFDAGFELLETDKEGFELSDDRSHWTKPLGDGIFNIMYLHYYYEPDGLPITDGVLVNRGDDYATFNLPFDEWFEEEITYNTATGELTYSINGESKTVKAKPLNKKYVRIMMHPYGWWTGHDVKVDYIDIKVIKGNEEQKTEEQQTNIEQQTEEQQFENKETNTYELPLTWKEVEVAGMDGAMFDFGSKKVTFGDIYEYSNYGCDFKDPIIIDGNRLWSFGDFGRISGNYYNWKNIDEGFGFDAKVDDIYLAEMPYNVKAICYDMYGAGWFIADDNGKIHYVIFEEYNETTDKTGNVKIYLVKPKVDVVVANLDVDELMAGIPNNGKNYKIVLGWKGNKLYLITMDAKKFEDWAYNSRYTKGYSEPFPSVKIREFDFDGNIIDARGEYGAGNYHYYIVVATNNGLYIITVENREPDKFKIADTLKTNIKVYAFDVYSGILAYSDGNNVYYTDIKSRYESENSDRYVYYFGRNYEGALSLGGITGLSITTNYNDFGTQLKVAGNGYIKTYNIKFESKTDAEGNSLYNENGDPIYVVKFEPKNVYYDEVYDKYYDIKVPFAGKYIFREDWGNSKSGSVAFRVYTTDNKLYLFGTAWG